MCIRSSLGKNNRYNRKDSNVLLDEEQFEWADELNGSTNATLLEEPLLPPLK